MKLATMDGTINHDHVFSFLFDLLVGLLDTKQVLSEIMGKKKERTRNKKQEVLEKSNKKK